MVGTPAVFGDAMVTEAHDKLCEAGRVSEAELSIILPSDLLDEIKAEAIREERERCAKIVDKWNNEIWADDDRHDPYDQIADEIRAHSSLPPGGSE